MVAGGYLNAVEGKSVDYEFVAHRLAQVLRTRRPKIAFDRWNFKHLRPLVRAGIGEEVIDERFEEFGQGFQSMSPAVRELETMPLTSGLSMGTIRS
jgi:hypothetical protein